MSDAKLMMPLFCNGMFNCGGRRIRAVHLYDVSDGEHRYSFPKSIGRLNSRRMRFGRHRLPSRIVSTSSLSIQKKKKRSMPHCKSSAAAAH